MCYFCNNIPIFNDYINLPEEERDNCIVYNDENNRFHYWSEDADDFCGGVEIYDIHYCPICGRKLNKITDDNYKEIIKYLLDALEHENSFRKVVDEQIGIKHSFRKEIKTKWELDI